MKTLTSFHNLTDTEIRPYQSFDGSQWRSSGEWVTGNYNIFGVAYQFFPHFHPYVLNLIQNLNNGGIDELQASDTVYLPNTPSQPNSGQPLAVLPHTTSAVLLANTVVTTNSGSFSLTPGTPLVILDHAPVTISNPTTVLYPDGSTGSLTSSPTVSLPGQIPISTPSGIQWTIGGKVTVIPDGTPVTLGTAAQGLMTDTKALVLIPAGTSLAIRCGQPVPYLFSSIFSATAYGPQPPVSQPYPVKNIDFSLGGAYSAYNWEIFFHVPLLIAVHLSQNQQFQEAQNWFHYIFNPSDTSDGPTPQRFWRVQPFQSTHAESIQQILVNLSVGADPQLQAQTMQSIDQWKSHPFQPWAVAQFRPTAYMIKTVMAYLDNLLAFGDSLFAQYTIETINEATQLYILAANILGPKPQAVPGQGTPKPLTYNQLRGKLNDFGDTLVEMEADIPFDTAPLPSPGSNPPGTQILPSLGQTLYFCVPQNDQLLAYWDQVATRLFNIHNSLNLQGVYQKLPLYDPPIDPGLLVKAAAAGLDISAIVSGLNQPLPLVRFRLLISKAMEICQLVQTLGAGILTAMEKRDNESMSLLRAQHESVLLGLAQMVKYSQWQEATKARQALEQSFGNAAQRYTYYQQLLGREPADINKSLPTLADLDTAGLENFNFTQADPTGEPALSLDAISIGISSDAPVSDGGIKTLIGHEVEETNLTTAAEVAHALASASNAIAAVVGVIPEMKGHAQPLGVGVTIGTSGIQLSGILNALADVARGTGDVLVTEASKAGKAGSYERRQQDWMNQSNGAKGEMNLIFKQWRGAQIREAMAEKEYNNHLQQISQAKDIETFLEGQKLAGFPVKETTIDFYSWMKRETQGLHSKAFQLAYEVAKKAERALQNELGNSTIGFVQNNYLDGPEGLLAGDRLQLDLKTMDAAYLDLHQREYEMTKHISLLQVSPLSLIQLRQTGTCLVSLPEELFDLDGPGHYFRRVKSVALTIPCVTGPYTSVNCTLSLQQSSIRISTNVGKGYARMGSNDLRFSDYFGALQTIVTSSAQSDSGLFETNLNDERYLPFEGVGPAGSAWQLTLPADVPQFDFDTITDVILHFRYTAREGGQTLKNAAVGNLQKRIAKAQTVGSVRLFSMRHEFPSDWAKFKAAPAGSLAPLAFSLVPQHFPYWASKLKSITLQSAQFLAETNSAGPINLYDGINPATAKKDALKLNPGLGMMNGTLVNLPLPVVSDPAQPLIRNTYYFDNNAMKDLWMALTWPKQK